MATPFNPKTHPKQITIQVLEEALDVALSELSQAEMKVDKANLFGRETELQMVMLQAAVTVKQINVESLQEAISWVTSKPAF